VQSELTGPVQRESLLRDVPVEHDDEHEQIQRDRRHVVVDVHLPDGDTPQRGRVMHIPVRHELVQQPHQDADEQHQHVDLEQQAQNDRNPELDAHERVNQRLLQAGGLLHLRGAMTAPVDETADAPQRQQAVEDQIDQQLIRLGHDVCLRGIQGRACQVTTS
jgi:hypothetical protein